MNSETFLGFLVHAKTSPIEINRNIKMDNRDPKPFNLILIDCWIVYVFLTTIGIIGHNSFKKYFFLSKGNKKPRKVRGTHFMSQSCTPPPYG